jgi:hypothetical protein
MNDYIFLVVGSDQHANQIVRAMASVRTVEAYSSGFCGRTITLDKGHIDSLSEGDSLVFHSTIKGCEIACITITRVEFWSA